MLDLFIDAILILAAVPNILILASVVVRGARVCRFDVGAQFKTLRSWRNTMVWGILVIPIICVMPLILLNYSNSGAWRLMEPTRLNRWSVFFWRGFPGVVCALGADIFLCILAQAVARSRPDYPQTNQGQG